MFLVFVNILFLIKGTFMDATPAIIIFTPILYPVSQKLGIDPVHFGIVLVANLGLGFITPPVGSCLYVAASIGKTSIEEVAKRILPFYGMMFVALMAITYWPDMTLFVPRLLGYGH